MYLHENKFSGAAGFTADRVEYGKCALEKSSWKKWEDLKIVTAISHVGVMTLIKYITNIYLFFIFKIAETLKTFLKGKSFSKKLE